MRNWVRARAISRRCDAELDVAPVPAACPGLFARLLQRVVSNVSPAATTQYLYDEFGHVVLETDSAGNSFREYIWLGDMPIAIIDQVNSTTPVLYYVHADHLDRPVMVTNSAGASVWQAIWTPFGAPQSITGTLTYNSRFPGQWFQIENGLNWNWNRHYDPTTGRYLQVDPEGLAAMLADGPSRYGYARQSPLAWIDPNGTQGVEGIEGAAERVTEACEESTACSTLAAAAAETAAAAGESVAKGVAAIAAACFPPPPGDCTPEQHRDLQDRVENACGAAGACSLLDSVATLNAKIGNISHCMTARSRINDTCFRGGNVKHNQAIDERNNSLNRCLSYLGRR